MCYVNNNLSKFVTKKNVGGSFTFEAYNSKEYTDGISFSINQDGQYKVNHVLDNKWENAAVLVTKDDLNNAMRFIGNAVSLRVRSGNIGIKNMYFDMLDSSGNMASIGFISDEEKAITFAVGGTTVWKIPIS